MLVSGSLAFGWYVQRMPIYPIFYGPSGAGIATLVWLYIACLARCWARSPWNGVLFRA